MSELRDPDVTTDAERRGRDAVRALPAAAPDPAWRARLGAAFASGTVPEGPWSAVPVAPDPPDDEAPAPAPVLVLPRRRPRLVPWLAAAAAAAIVVAWLGRPPEWQVVGATPIGTIVLDSGPVALTDPAHFAARIAHGARFRVEGGRLWLRAPGTIAIEVTPGTDVILPAPPARWFARAMAAHITTGELRITTGPRFHGAHLAVTTPEARVEVTGTTLAVIREPGGTCVCVYEGRVMVGPMHGDMRAVTGGDRRYVFADGHRTEEATMRDNERPELARLRAAQMPEMEAGR